MATRYQQRKTLEREHDAADSAMRRMLADRTIIDATAVVILQEAEAAPVALTSPAIRIPSVDLPAPTPWRSWRVWLAAAIVIGVVASVIGSTIVPSGPTRIFTIGTVTEGNLIHTVKAPGTISANVMSLHFATTGQIAAIDVQAGQSVQAGQVLAQLNSTALVDAVTTQQQAVTTAHAGYQTALVAWQNARSSQSSADAVAQAAYNAALTAQPPPTAAQAQLARDQRNLATIQAQNQVNVAQTQLAVAQSQIALAQTQLVAAQHALTHATLVAPSSGQISAISSSVGATVTSADAIITLADLTSLRLVAAINEADIGTVNTGWPVAFTLPTFPQTTFYGTVTGVSSLGQVNQGSVSYPVTIALAAYSTNARLYPGMTANITLTTEEAIDATLVPNTALAYAQAAAQANLIASNAVQQALTAAQHMRARQQNLTAGTASFVLQYQRGQLTAIPIVTGITDGTSTVILAGLSSTQPVVVGDNHHSVATVHASSGS